MFSKVTEKNTVHMNKNRQPRVNTACDFEVLCNEYQKKGGKIMDSFSKYFEKPKDLGEVFTYLFDLDIHGWNVSIAYFDNRKLVTIALERPIA